MRITSFLLAALAVPSALAAPADLDIRQAKPRELSRSSSFPSVKNTSSVLSTVNPGLFPALQRYSKFAVASLVTVVGGGTCAKPPYQSKLVATIRANSSDTQVAIFQDDTAKELIISFPGTTSMQDALTDVVIYLTPFTTAPGCTGCKVHLGLLTGWRGVQVNLTNALTELQARYPLYSTVIVGHSLGGGLASVAYTDLKSNGVSVRAAYTMGSLRVGNHQYAAFTDALSGASDTAIGSFVRLTHASDGVPSLPPAGLGFRHTRTEIFGLDDPATGLQTAATTFRCYGSGASDCNGGMAQGLINKDHLTYAGISMVNGDTCNSKVGN